MQLHGHFFQSRRRESKSIKPFWELPVIISRFKPNISLLWTFSISVFFDYSDDKEVVCVDEEKQSKGTVMKAKLLQFHENYRPAYYGTWRKNSKHITARKPLGQDQVNPLDFITFDRVPTRIGKMGRHLPVREKSGNFEQTGKVRENHTK